MITGTDTKSSQAMETLDQGGSLAELMSLGLTRDQAKKLSRLHKMRRASRHHLPDRLYQKFHQLGLKALVLHPMVRNEDWSGLVEILETVDPDIKRSDLARLPAALAEKRERVREMEEEVNLHLRSLEKMEQSIRDQIQEIQQTRATVEKNLSFLKPYPPKIKDFLADHLGVSGGKLCLAKRLDHNWQQRLRKKGVIRYDEDNFVHFVEDVDAIVKDIEKRLKRGWRIYYDPEYVNSFFDPPEDPHYYNAQEIEGSLKKQLKEQQEKLEDLHHQRKTIQKEIRTLRRKKPESFMEAIELSNQLSAKDMKTHGELQSLSLRWLYERGYVAATELSLGKYRCDVVGYNEDGRICIIEAKASLEDFRRDTKWQEYLPYCDEYYFAVQSLFSDELLETGAGILKPHRNRGLNQVQECELDLEAKDREQTMFNISRGLTKKFVYGY